MTLTQSRYTLDDINHMDKKTFTETLGWIYEHSPWVAEQTWKSQPFSSVDQLHSTMKNTVADAEDDEQLRLLQAHPNLGTKAKVAPASKQEQAGAGLDRLSEEAYEAFVQLNEDYDNKFSFPFIMAVSGQNKDVIQQAMADRLQNSPAEERKRALQEVHKIARIRLDQMI